MTIKKNIILLSILLSAFMMSCNTKEDQKNDNHFILRGTFYNAPQHTKIFLVHIPYETDEQYTIDSTEIDALGHYTLNAKNEPKNSLLSLTCHNMPERIIIINDTFEEELNIDYNNMLHYEVKKSIASSALQQLFAVLKHTDSLTMITNDSLEYLLTNDSKKIGNVSALIHFKDSLKSNFNSYLYQRALSEKHPAVVYYILGMSMITMSPDSIASLSTQVSKKFSTDKALMTFSKQFTSKRP
ncbi:MAG: hypothetical protein QM528_09485 [Phycisphaerales bacterium]|nr:hypothetical protein [Phycisphaerales bacterium]